MNKAEKAVEVCGARQRAQIRVEGVETVPSATSIVQLLAASTLGPEVIEKLAESLPSLHAIYFYFFEFRRVLSRKMQLYVFMYSYVA